MKQKVAPIFASRHLKMDDMPKTIPLFPLAGTLLLPRTDLPLNIFEPRYLEMINDAMYSDRIIGIIQPLAGEEVENPSLEKIGCAGRITAYAESEDGRFLITLTGISRFKIKKEIRNDVSYRSAQVEYKSFATDFVVEKDAQLVNRPQLIAAFRLYLEANNMNADWSEVNAVSTEVLVNTLSLMAPYPAREKQALLEAPDLKSRADVLVALTEMALAKSGSTTPQRMQ